MKNRNILLFLHSNVNCDATHWQTHFTVSYPCVSVHNEQENEQGVGDYTWGFPRCHAVPWILCGSTLPASHCFWVLPPLGATRRYNGASSMGVKETGGCSATELTQGISRWFPCISKNQSQGSSPLSRDACGYCCLPASEGSAWLLYSAPQANTKSYLLKYSRYQWLKPMELTYQKFSLLWLNCSKSRQGKEWNNPLLPSISHLRNYRSSSKARRGMRHPACHYSPNSGLFSEDKVCYKVEALQWLPPLVHTKGDLLSN